MKRVRICPICGRGMKLVDKGAWFGDVVGIYRCEDDGLFADLPVGLTKVENASMVNRSEGERNEKGAKQRRN